MEWESVGKVSKVFVYPVKSCKAISVETADADSLGLLYKGVRDRYILIMSYYMCKHHKILNKKIVNACRYFQTLWESESHILKN